MNPLFMGAIVGGIVHLLKRTCPKCRREQIVGKDDAGKALPCKYCGFIIQPPNKDWRGYRPFRHKAALFHTEKKQRS